MSHYDNYLDRSIENLKKLDLKNGKKLLNDEYNFMKEKTILLFNKVIESKINHIKIKMTLAACFWIIIKFCDDHYYYDDEIAYCFDIGSILKKRLKSYELIILDKIDWNLSFI